MPSGCRSPPVLSDRTGPHFVVTSRLPNRTSLLKGGFSKPTGRWQKPRVPGRNLGRYPLAGVALAAPPIMWRGTNTTNPSRPLGAPPPPLGGSVLPPTKPTPTKRGFPHDSCETASRDLRRNSPKRGAIGLCQCRAARSRYGPSQLPQVPPLHVMAQCQVTHSNRTHNGPSSHYGQTRS